MIRKLSLPSDDERYFYSVLHFEAIDDCLFFCYRKKINKNSKQETNEFISLFRKCFHEEPYDVVFIASDDNIVYLTQVRS